MLKVILLYLDYKELHYSFLLLCSKLCVSPKDVFKLIHSFLFKRIIVSCISKDRNTRKPIELFFLNSTNIIQVTFHQYRVYLRWLSRSPHCIAQGILLNALWWPKWEGNPKRRGYIYIYIYISDSLFCIAKTNTL